MKSSHNKIPVILIVVFIIGLLLCFSEFLFKPFTHLTSESKSKAEEELACFLEYSEGVGKAIVKICYTDEGRVAGVAVVCTGANDPLVRSEVTQLVSKSLGVPTNRVYVSSSSEAFEKHSKEGHS